MTDDPSLNCQRSADPALAQTKAGAAPIIAVASHMPGPCDVHDRATMEVLGARVAALLGLP